MLVFLVACGGRDDNDNQPTQPDAAAMPTGLACNAVTYCSTWSANDDEPVEAPAERGGTIADGIYRLERGTFSSELLQFQGTRFNSIGDSFDNGAGTYVTTDGAITFDYDQRCDADGTEPSTNSWADRPYRANGDVLLIGMADSSDGSIVWYEYKRISVDQICTENANVSCEVTNCSCAVVTNGFGTVMSGTKSCSS
jgi:hypothetical protein